MKKRDYRRGVAIEMAVGMMFLVIALSILLLTISSLQAKNQRYDLEAYEKKVLEFTIEDMEKVGAESHTISINKTNYEITKSDTKYEIKADGESVYTVTVTNGTISAWK